MSMVIETLSKGVRNNMIDSNASLVYILLSVNETSKVTENRCSWVQQSQASLVTLGCSEQRSVDPKQREQVETSPGIQKTAGRKSTREQVPGTTQTTGIAQRTDMKQRSDKDKTKRRD